MPVPIIGAATRIAARLGLALLKPGRGRAAFYFQIRGMREVRQMIVQAEKGVSPRNLREAVGQAGLEAQTYARSTSHVDTGLLRASHALLLAGRGGSPRAEVYISAASRAAVYGPIEHDRGGSHAFYDRVVSERGEAILSRAEEYINKQLPH